MPRGLTIYVRACVIAGLLLVFASLAAAQDSLQFNVPYLCSDGSTYVVHRCEKGPKFEFCYYQRDQNSERYNKRADVWNQMRQCKLKGATPVAASASQASSSQASSSWPSSGLQMNTPYECPGGITLTVSQCQAQNAQDYCLIGVEQNGKVLGQIAKPRSETVTHLKACKPTASATRGSQQGTSDYTKDLPSVQRVENEIKGTDPNDSLARQVAVFEYLQIYIQRIKEARDYRGPFTPGERKLMGDYAKAQYDLTQSYTKAHAAAEVTAFNRVVGRYSLNNALGWIRQIEGPLAAEAYKASEASLAASYQRNQQRIQQGLSQPQSSEPSDVAGMIGEAFEVFNDSPEGRRCLELGGTSAQCANSSLMQGIGNWMGADSNAPPPLNGVVLIGNYHSRSELPSLNFGAGAATLEDCGKLVADPHDYTIRKSGGAILLVLANEPNDIVLTLRPDGSLAGPGSIPVKGRIIIGTHNEYSCRTNNYGARTCNTTSTPIYQAKMDRCTISQLAFAPPKPVATPKTGIRLLDATDEDTALVNGFRMTGQYADGSRLALEFDNDAVTLDCGKAHVRAPYTVENSASGFMVHVQNSGGAFLLAVAPDDTLRGNGSTTVNGRLVTSINGQNVSFAPHSESCSIGTLSPKGTRNTMMAGTRR